MYTSWEKHSKYIEENVHKKTLQEMAKELRVDQESLRLHLHYTKKFHIKNEDNIILRLLTNLIGYPEYFNPTRRFFEATKIGQRRWWMLFRGERIPTDFEYRSICQHLGVDVEDSYAVRQLELFK